MSELQVNRRQTLTALSAFVGASFLPETAHSTAASMSLQPQHAVKPVPAFTPSLNMSTIRGHKLGFVKELEIASRAGFRSVEIWMDGLQGYVKSGNTTAQLRTMLKDLGLQVENAIGFAQWIINDDTARAKGLDQLKQEMTLLAEIGCHRTAAPPVGATDLKGEKLDLRKAAERYRTILELGDQTGVMPQLELWGFSNNLSRLSEVMFVAIESGHPKARLLLDVYHLYKGGSSLDSLQFVGKPAMEIFHVNDYTANFPRETIVDADRIYPGDGIAPIRDILRTIKTEGKSIVLSLEVFNKSYYAQDAAIVAKTSFEKMKKMIDGLN